MPPCFSSTIIFPLFTCFKLLVLFWFWRFPSLPLLTLAKKSFFAIIQGQPSGTQTWQWEIPPLTNVPHSKTKNSTIKLYHVISIYKGFIRDFPLPRLPKGYSLSFPFSVLGRRRVQGPLTLLHLYQLSSSAWRPWLRYSTFTNRNWASDAVEHGRIWGTCHTHTYIYIYVYILIDLFNYIL